MSDEKEHRSVSSRRKMDVVVKWVAIFWGIGITVISWVYGLGVYKNKYDNTSSTVVATSLEQREDRRTLSDHGERLAKLETTYNMLPSIQADVSEIRRSVQQLTVLMIRNSRRDHD